MNDMFPARWFVGQRLVVAAQFPYGLMVRKSVVVVDVAADGFTVSPPGDASIRQRFTLGGKWPEPHMATIWLETPDGVPA